MKALLLAMAMFPFPLAAGLPLKIELLGPEADPIVIGQEALEVAAPIARAAKEMTVLREMEELDEDELKKLREVEKKLANGRALKQGIVFTLRFTNPTNTPVTFQYGPDVSSNTLELEGPGAIHLPYTGMMTMEFRQPRPTTIAPGGSKDFVIAELAYGQRDMSRWLVSEPGTYTVRLRFSTRVGREKVELRSNAITFAVKAGE